MYYLQLLHYLHHYSLSVFNAHIKSAIIAGTSKDSHSASTHIKANRICAITVITSIYSHAHEIDITYSVFIKDGIFCLSIGKIPAF